MTRAVKTVELFLYPVEVQALVDALQEWMAEKENNELSIPPEMVRVLDILEFRLQKIGIRKVGFKWEVQET